MDNLTHGLLGACIGMARPQEGGPEHDAPLTPTDRAVPWATFLAAELPDIDVFFGSGPLDQFVYHRGWTHSLVVTPAIAAIAAGVAKLIWRKARFRTLLPWAWLSVLIAHVMNDWMTGWGTRVLLPFSDARLGLDWVPIIDPLYTVPLIAAVIWAARRPRIRRRVIAGLLLYLALYTFGYRGVSQALVAHAVGEAYAGQPVQQLRVSPDLFNPLRWLYTVDLGDRYEQGTAFPLGELQPGSVTVKAPADEVVRAVRQAPELQPFFDQFPFATIEYQRTGDGYVVTLGDVRYRLRGHGLAYTVVLTENLQVARVIDGGW